MQDLLELVSTGEFEDVGSLRLVCAAFQSNVVVLEFLLEPSASESQQRWKVTCVDTTSHRLTASHFGIVRVVADHPLLWSAASGRGAQLLFAKRPDSVMAAVGALYAAHARVAGHWLDAYRYINRQYDLAALLEAGNGALAEGPTPLLEAYRDAVNQYEASAYLLNEKPETQTSEASQQALLLDDDFVVARTFEAVRLT